MDASGQVPQNIISPTAIPICELCRPVFTAQPDTSHSFVRLSLPTQSPGLPATATAIEREVPDRQATARFLTSAVWRSLGVSGTLEVARLARPCPDSGSSIRRSNSTVLGQAKHTLYGVALLGPVAPLTRQTELEKPMRITILIRQ